jgi:hypothetical protein
MKQIIRLTESDLHNIVRQCVNEITLQNHSYKSRTDRGELKVYISEIVGEYGYDEKICQEVSDVLAPILHEDPVHPTDGYIMVGYENIGAEKDVNYYGEFNIEADEAIELLQNSGLDDDLKQTCIKNLQDQDAMWRKYVEDKENSYIPDDREPWHEQ